MGIPCTPSCEERSVTCHGTCEKYKEWKAEYAKQKTAEKFGRMRYGLTNEPYSFGKTHRPSKSHKK